MAKNTPQGSGKLRKIDILRKLVFFFGDGSLNVARNERAVLYMSTVHIYVVPP